MKLAVKYILPTLPNGLKTPEIYNITHKSISPNTESNISKKLRGRNRSAANIIDETQHSPTNDVRIIAIKKKNSRLKAENKVNNAVLLFEDDVRIRVRLIYLKM